MKTILITGSAGLIGSHLCNHFLNKGFRVIGVDNLIGGYSSNMPINAYFTFINMDILDVFSLKHVFELYTPETVIHCAALAHEGLSVFSPKTITENIYSGTISVASAAISAKIKTFINTSSMARYGNIDAPFKEDLQANPVDPYGMAKLQAEEQLNLLSLIHNFKVVHIVPHNVCGPNQCFTDPFRNVVSIFANRIIHKKPIYIYGNGEQLRSFSHIDDCIKAFDTIYENIDTIKSKSVFNIGPDDGSEITINELAEIVLDQFSSKVEIIHLPDRPREVKNAWVSITKAKNILGYKTTKSTKEAILDTINWIKSKPISEFNYHLQLEIVNDKTPKTWTDKLFND